jgi:hypothetical protein
MRKNVNLQAVFCQLVARSDGTAVTTGTTTVYVCPNVGGQYTGVGTVTHIGNGTWQYLSAQAETNYNQVAYRFENSLAVSALVQFNPIAAFDPTAATGLAVNMTAVDGVALSTHASGMVPADLRDIAGAAVSTSSAQLGVNVVNVGGTAQTARDVGAQLDVPNSTRASQSSVTDVQARLPAALVSGRMDSSVGAMAANVLTASAIASAALSSAKFAADAGLAPLATGTVVDADVATVTFDSGALATANYYVGCWVRITSGTGVNQVRTITGYTSGRVATLDSDWATLPLSSPTYAILPKHVMSAAQIAAAVLNAIAASYNTANTIGRSINDAAAGGGGGGGGASAADVWAYGNRTLTAITAGVVQTGVTVGNNAVVGARQVTVHVETAAHVAIADCSVSVFDSANTNLIDRKMSSAGGNAVFALDDGSYRVRLSKAGSSFTVPETLTVSGDGTVTYTGSAYAVPTPVLPSGCVISGTVRDASGEAIAGAAVDAYALTPQHVGSVHYGKALASTVTDNNGNYSIELEQGLTVQFVIDDGEIENVTKTVPAAAGVAFADWV